MALVMLPCDLPWWPQVQRQLTQLALSRSSRELIETMEKIHSMCNISLDPDEEAPDPALFEALERFLEEELTPEERRHFLEKTSPAMVQRALQLKSLKPPGGLHFSLQQQADKVQLERSFVASLLAHSFFSTFPKRTPKTHPTLQDFNFSDFFRHLDTQCQKAKLRSILQYFDHLENEGLPEEKVIFSRQVMSSKDWLTIEDWLECGLPLVPLLVRHEGRLDRAEADSLHVCFSSSRVGGDVLSDGFTQECLQFCTQPELLTMLSCVEALEDNEVLAIDGVMQVARISGPRHRASMDPLAKPPLLSVCCMDAEIYTTLPISQLEEDNVLRELNKALLGFRQKRNPSTPTLDLSPNAPPTSTASSNTTTSGTSTLGQQQSKRLSPIGESFSSTPPEKAAAAVATAASTAPAAAGAARKDLLQPPAPAAGAAVVGVGPPTLGPGGRRGRFIVLGSSGECLPVSRAACSLYSSCQSESDDEFHSARTSLEHDDSESEEAGARRYSAQLDTPERRSTFAARLRDALCRGAAAADDLSDSSDDSSSYAVGITVAGAGLQDGDIRVRRGGSRGFMLQEDSTDAGVLERECRRAQRRSGARGTRGASSCYSFSTEFSSELEELCDQYHRWLGDVDAEAGGAERELDARDIAVVRFASSLLKRTLSDSFAGAPLPLPLLAEGVAGAGVAGADLADLGEPPRGAHRIAAVARSLSLELARHNHRLAAQLVSLLGTAGRKGSAAPGLKAVASGNWGCGSRGAGDPQLKLIVQWLAASVAGVPALAYYTCGHSRLLKLDTVARVLLDRRWTVGELVTATLRHAQDTLQATAAGSTPPGCLFDELLGMEKPSPPPTTTL